MTPRENTLSLYRRNGYSYMPVSFGMCPAVRQKMVDAIGEGVSPTEYYDYPEGSSGAGCPRPKGVQGDAIDWRAFYDEELPPDTSFNACRTVTNRLANGRPSCSSSAADGMAVLRASSIRTASIWRRAGWWPCRPSTGSSPGTTPRRANA